MNCYEHTPGRWKNYTLFAGRGSLPKVAGVYAVFFDRALVYVGSSTDVANRFSEHKFRYGYRKNIITPWCDVPAETQITIRIKRSVRRGDWAMWEIRLIHRLKPQFNRQHRGRRIAA